MGLGLGVWVSRLSEVLVSVLGLVLHLEKCR